MKNQTLIAVKQTAHGGIDFAKKVVRHVLDRL